ncbi:MAG: hypothetical protein NVSMB5_20350 [Candidatus Velthaea sp.]
MRSTRMSISTPSATASSHTFAKRIHPDSSAIRPAAYASKRRHCTSATTSNHGNEQPEFVGSGRLHVATSVLYITTVVCTVRDDSARARARYRDLVLGEVTPLAQAGDRARGAGERAQQFGSVTAPQSEPAAP